MARKTGFPVCSACSFTSRDYAEHAFEQEASFQPPVLALLAYLVTVLQNSHIYSTSTFSVNFEGWQAWLVRTCATNGNVALLALQVSMLLHLPDLV